MSVLNGTLPERVKEYFYEVVLIAISSEESEKIAGFIRGIVKEIKEEEVSS